MFKKKKIDLELFIEILKLSKEFQTAIIGENQLNIKLYNNNIII